MPLIKTFVIHEVINGILQLCQYTQQTGLYLIFSVLIYLQFCDIYDVFLSVQILRIRGLYFKSALSQDIGWFDVQQTGDFASRMSE
jgi:ATP-binding cassette subfamily B (MDR/TAP) protein 1